MTDHRIILGSDLSENADHIALADADRKITYRDYHRLVDASAVNLTDKGITSGQRVAIYAGNSLEYVINLVALIGLGAVACPVSVRIPGDAVTAMLDDIDCSTVLVGSQQAFQSDTVSVLPMILPEPASRPATALRQPDMDRPATIVFTSGTTSRPAGAILTLGNHYYNALGSNENIKLMPGDRWLVSLPLYHVGGLSILFRCQLSGATAALPVEGDSLIDCVRRLDVTHLSLVPTQLRDLLNHPDVGDTLRQIKAVLVGGGPVGRDLVDRAFDAGLNLYTTYGCTEMASQVTTTGAGDPRDKLYTSGRVLNHREVKTDADGEILVRGRTCFAGYANRGGTTGVFDNDGWFHTGDLGRFDSDGYLTVIGRKDNMFISGGENIHPEEIEEVVRRLPGVDEVIVVPIDDARYGRRPVAFVRRSGDDSIGLQEISAALADHLPRFKIPVKFLNWPDQGDSSGIKPDRRRLAALARNMSQET